jgi:uncharacterized protein (DUF2336 family)
MATGLMPQRILAMLTRRPDARVDIPLNGEQQRNAALLRATTELFAQEAMHDRDEIRRYEELATHFLPKVAIADRVFVAERLAPRVDAPLSLMRALAKDNIEIARLVIPRSPVLGALDLLTIIAATGAEHHRLIARRPGNSSEVEQALRIGGDAEVLAALGGGAAAHEARATAEPAPPTGEDGAWFAQRQAVQTRVDRYDPWAFLKLERAARLRLMADIAISPPPRRNAPAARPDRAFRAILGAAQIVGFARSGQRTALMTTVSESLEIESDFVAACLDDATGEPLAVLLKALNLDSTQAQQVFLLANEKVGRDVTTFFRLADLYAGMETSVAQTLADAWHRNRAEAAFRHEPVFAENGQVRRSAFAEQLPERQPAAARSNFGRAS